MVLSSRRKCEGAARASWIAIALGCFLGIGCQDSSPQHASPPKVSRPVDPKVSRPVDLVLDRMQQAYREAKSYRDEAVVNIKVHSPTEENAGDFDAKLEFARPNLLLMEFQPAVMMDRELVERLVVGDGKKIYAKSEGYDKQVVVTDAPQQDVASALFASKTVGPLLTDGLVGGSLVLGLLTSAELPAPLDRAKAKLLEPAMLEEHKFDRVEFATAEGNLTLWIDPKSSVVRRIEFPTAKLLQEQKQAGVTAIELTVDLNKAELNKAEANSERFKWTKAEGEDYVRELVQPPNLAEFGSKLIGQPLPAFQFITSSGEKRAAADFAGKVTVIDFWATWCSWCLKGMPAVDRIRKKYAGNDKVQFLALSEDKAEVKDQQIVDLLKQLKVDPPWARLASDNADELNATLQFDGIPAMIVLGPDGRVLYHHVGYDPKLEENLTPVIDALLASKDPSAQAIRVRDEKMRDYRRRLDAVRIDQPAGR